MTDKEPLILVFEGASIKALDELIAELDHVFKGTRFEDHYLVTNHSVKGVDYPHLNKLDEIIKLLERIEDNQ